MKLRINIILKKNEMCMINTIIVSLSPHFTTTYFINIITYSVSRARVGKVNNNTYQPEHWIAN